MNWDEYFIKIANLVSEKSKDRSTKVGAVIVSKDHSILSVGFNGFPRGVNDDVEDRHVRPRKYLYTEHAERNAIYNAAKHGIKLEGATLYMNGGGFPCADCARALIQAGIKEYVCIKKPFEGKGSLWEESCACGEEMMREAGIDINLVDENYKRV